MTELEHSVELTFEKEKNGDSQDRSDRQLTFARMIEPENWGINTDDFSGITAKDKRFMTINTLRKNLLFLPHDRRRSASFVEGEERRLVTVALTPIESKIVSRSAKRLGETAIDRTMASRIPRSDYDADVAAADRSALHVVSRYREGMENYLHRALVPDQFQLQRLKEYAEHHNLNRLKKSNSQKEISWLMTHIIEDTLVALRGQLEQSEPRGWNSQDDSRVRRALDYRLFAEGDGTTRVHNWQKLLDFEVEYNQLKVALFRSKIWDAKKHSR